MASHKHNTNKTIVTYFNSNGPPFPNRRFTTALSSQNKHKPSAPPPSPFKLSVNPSSKQYSKTVPLSFRLPLSPPGTPLRCPPPRPSPPPQLCPLLHQSRLHPPPPPHLHLPPPLLPLNCRKKELVISFSSIKFIQKQYFHRIFGFKAKRK